MAHPAGATALLALTASLAFAPALSASAAAPPGTIALAPGSQPEGISNGPAGTVYAGSRADGAIYRISLADGSRTLLVPGFANGAARGLQWDPRTGVLWVAGDVRGSGGRTTSTIIAYDARTGERLRRISVPGRRFLNDVEVTANGVYVTDSRSAELVVVRDRGYALLPLTGEFSLTPGNNANGIRELPDGDLVITQSSTGKLFKVDPATGVAAEIELTGTPLTSGDGLELRGGVLYVVYGFGTDEVAVVRLRDGFTRGIVEGAVGDPDLDRPTTAVLSAGALYAVNGRFSVPPTATTPYDIVRVDVPKQ